MATQPTADTHRDWRDRANAYLAHHDDVERWTDSYVRTMLRHSPAGEKLFIEAQDHRFWEALA